MRPFLKSPLFLCLALCLASASSAFAQRVCGSDYQQYYQHADAATRQRMDAIAQQTNSYRTSRNGSRTPGQIITIPVVVHIVYNTTAENVSDTQVQSQIAVLNEDFRLANADRTSIPSLFAPLAADFELQFALASTDPQGNATTGITRTSTSVTSFLSDGSGKYTMATNPVKFNASGGKDAWPRDKYLNLWVCHLSGGVLGYATLPGAPANVDGVVIDYTCFGRGGSAQAPYDKGRTATHEVGHWLNLFHIWGDDSGDCSGSDEVDDTPNQAGSNWGCPSFPHSSCSNTSDMFMNYMDYTDDNCMFMFSQGQKSRMEALFVTGGARAGFLAYSSCAANVNITQPITTNITHQASNSITATSSISTNLNVALRAGNYIVLNPGFTVTAASNSAFTANLASCTSSIRNSYEENSQEKALAEEAQIRVYPNPTHGKVSISLPAELTTKVAIQLYDAYGKLLPALVKATAPQTYEVDLLNHPAGLYFIRVKNNEGWTTEKSDFD